MVKRRLRTFEFVLCPRDLAEYSGNLINAEECEGCEHYIEEESEVGIIICSYPMDINIEWLFGVLPNIRR